MGKKEAGTSQKVTIDDCRSHLSVSFKPWDSANLGDLFEFKNGLNKAKRFFGAGTPIVNFTDVFESPGLRSYELTGRVNLSEEELRKFDVRKGDVFFTRTSETVEDIGFASVMLDDPVDTVFSGFVLRARPLDHRLNNNYKRYCFASSAVRSQIVSIASYTTRALTNGKSLSAVRVLIPPIVEQRAIAEVLSDVDALIAALDALIAKKQAIKQAAMQQLLTGRTRLPGFSGEWETTLMKRIGSTYSGLTGKSKTDFGAGEAQYLTFINVLENVTLDQTHTSRVHVEPNESQNPVLKGDLLFNGTSETPSELAMGTMMGEQINSLYLNSFCFGFRIHDENTWAPMFLVYLFRSSIGRTVMRALAQGATRYNMSKLEFLNLEISIPSYEEQCAIATVLSDMDSEIETLKRRLAKTYAIKQGMMQDLLTGRVRLVKTGG